MYIQCQPFLLSLCHMRYSYIFVQHYNKQITYYSYVVDKKKSTRSRHTI